MIKVENIQGKLLLIGAEDDVLWNVARYIHRMEKRLAEHPHNCEVESVVYEHGTHLKMYQKMKICFKKVHKTTRKVLRKYQMSIIMIKVFRKFIKI